MITAPYFLSLSFSPLFTPGDSGGHGQALPADEEIVIAERGGAAERLTPGDRGRL